MADIPKRSFKVMDIMIIRSDISRITFFIEALEGDVFGIEDSIDVKVADQIFNVLITSKERVASSSRYYVKGLVMNDLKEKWAKRRKMGNGIRK